MFNQNNQFNDNFKKNSKVDPYGNNFDYDEYKRRWFGAFRQPDVYIPLLFVIIGIGLALSTIVWPCTSKFKFRAIIAVLITYLSTQFILTGIKKHMNDGE